MHLSPAVPAAATTASFCEPWASAPSMLMQEADISGHTRTPVPEAVYRIPHGGSSASGRFRPPPGLEEVGASGSSQLAQARPADTPVVPFWCSKGSFGHPQLCGRPCVHVAKGGVCPSGLACTYCHFLPHAAVVKPGGSMRRTLLAATDQELLATFLPFIRKKAGKEGLLPLANDLINLLEAEMHEPPPTSISLVSFRPMKMTFMHLVASSMRRLPLHIQVEVQRLKANLPPPALTPGSWGMSLVL
ncbi:unnamed protein product [Symbiodinium natans]|uniref:C3H1-type domain-containing protein n=1 Tax=Symbiodinium natans TaxID=878477 RepID=A0A812UJW2_9DINO|nr:unnamed protein product [Symbiodinium natans]